jgi:molybdenum cofactor cytidylyltransferase
VHVIFVYCAYKPKSMSCKIDDSAVIILAAGVSGRMGFPKPLLKFNDDECFLEHIINQYARADIGEIIVVAGSLLYGILLRRDFQFLTQIKLVLNAEPDLGRLHSVVMGLREAGQGKCCFIQNVDQPFIDVAMIKSLAAKVHPESYVAPVFKGEGGHPVLLGKSVVKHLISITDVHTDLRDVLGTFQKVQVEAESDDVCINLNSVADYKRHFGREPGVV